MDFESDNEGIPVVVKIDSRLGIIFIKSALSPKSDYKLIINFKTGEAMYLTPEGLFHYQGMWERYIWYFNNESLDYIKVGITNFMNNINDDNHKAEYDDMYTLVKPDDNKSVEEIEDLLTVLLTMFTWANEVVKAKRAQEMEI